MKKRRQVEMFSISFLDLLSGALGAVIILYVAIPKSKPQPKDLEKEVLQRELADKKEELKKAEEKLKELEAKTVAVVPAVNPAPEETEEKPKESGSDFDVGFKFKGKNVVFLLDTSYSMVEEDRMGQVKAGLKMLLTSLPPNFKIELVQYPLGERAPFKSMWGTTRESTRLNKQDAFDHMSRLRPAGGTPTRDALLFVLRNYENLSDIVLLTDGVPTYHNSNRKDDIHDILTAVKAENHRGVQINTIGVGTNFLSDKDSDQYKFLSGLAEGTGGFFVGF